MKRKLIKDIKYFLEKEGFSLFEYRRGCFDIVARRDELILIKVLTNIDSFLPKQAAELKLLSKMLSAKPVIIGSRTRKCNLEDDVMYERFGLPALTVDTLKSTIEGEKPSKLRKRGGMFGKVSPKKLRRARKEKGLTQTELANRLNVSQKNISEHEKGLERIRYPVMESAKNILNQDIEKTFEPFNRNVTHHKENMEKGSRKCKIGERLTKVGFKISYTKRSPPDMIVKEKVSILTSIGQDEKKIKKNVEDLVKFSKISESPAFIVNEKIESTQLPVISREDIENIEDSEELIKIIDERNPY